MKRLDQSIFIAWALCAMCLFPMAAAWAIAIERRGRL
jgi:hypothetical protein